MRLGLWRRDACRFRGHIQRPPEMLARMPPPDVAAVMQEHLLVKLVDEPQLALERGYFFSIPAEKARYLPRQPRPPAGPSPDHQTVGAGSQ